MAPADHQSHRRAMRAGLTTFDEERACPCINLYAPYYGSGQLCLIDLHGAEVNQVFRSTHYLARKTPALG